MPESKTTHSEVVEAVRKALVSAASRAYDSPANHASTTLQLSQAYENVLRTGHDFNADKI